MVERDAVLAELRAAVLAATAGRPSALLVVGEHGSGLSAVLDAAASAVIGTGALVLTHRGRRRWRDRGHAAVEALIAQLPEAPGGAPAPRPGNGPSALDEQFRSRIAEAARVHGGLTVVLDDAHVVDAESLRCLLPLARRGAAAPITLIGGVHARSVDVAVRGLDDGWDAVLELSALSTDGVARMLADRGLLPTTAQQARVAAATEGRPRLVERIVADIGGGMTLNAAVEDWRASTLEGTLLRRLLDGSWAATRLARALAVLDGDDDLVAAVAELERPDLRAARRELLDLGILSDEGQGIRFATGDAATVIERAMIPSTRAQFHRRAATARTAAGGDVERIAVDWELAGELDDPRMSRALHRAAELAAQRGAYERAISLLRAVLDGTDPTVDRITLLAAVGRLEIDRGDPVRAQGWLAQAVDAAPAGAERAAAEACLVRSLVAEPGDGPSELGPLGSSPAAADRLSFAATLAVWDVPDPGWWPAWQAAFTELSPSSATERTVLAACAIQSLCAGGDPVRSAALAQRAWAEEALLDDLPAGAPVLTGSVRAIAAADPEAARVRADAAARRAADERSPVARVAWAALLAELDQRRGDFAQAAERLREAEATAVGLVDEPGARVARLELAIAILRLASDRHDAEAAADRSARLVPADASCLPRVLLAHHLVLRSVVGGNDGTGPTAARLRASAAALHPRLDEDPAVALARRDPAA